VLSGFPDDFHANLKTISFDETTHVNFLTQALGAAAVAPCTYSFPSTDPASFVALASVLEGVGVSAYLGAAADILDKGYLTDAGSILTVEARHSAFLRRALKQSPFPQPFDTPLDLDEVYTLAAAFIVACPSTNAPLPVVAFPTLTLETTGTIDTGDTIAVLFDLPQTPTSRSTADADSKSPIYGAFITVTGPIYVNTQKINGGVTLVVPSGISGQSYLVLTKNNTGPVTDDNVIAGPAIVEVTGS
jgi:hypothetical protein